MSDRHISGSTRVAAVIGSPVRHSLSPTLHNAAFSAGGLDWRFVAFDVAAGRAMAAVAAMQLLGIGGLAVTMPHKADVATAVDELDPAAAALASVNTVVLRADGSTFGASTDGDGFVNALASDGFEVDGKRVVLLGAGAAARSIVDALGRAGAATISIVNRTTATAAAAARLSAGAHVGSLADVETADLVVNTTPVGMAGQPNSASLPLPESLLRPDLAVADIVYHPLSTPLLLAARAVGAPTFDGLGMLIHQAALQQQLWTGVTPDVRVLREAAMVELGTR
ncbi:MAG TPA: shikimate dehydrogenase [Ilumatobacter sp.]|nr:shikimate dehydrogenase [Ilumatobacter sp.]